MSSEDVGVRRKFAARLGFLACALLLSGAPLPDAHAQCHAIVTERVYKNVQLITLPTGEITPLASGLSQAGSLKGVAVNALETTAYIVDNAGLGNGDIFAMNLTPGATFGDLEVVAGGFTYAEELALNSDESIAYVATFDEFLRVDLTTGSATLVSDTWFRGLALDADESTAWVISGSTLMTLDIDPLSPTYGTTSGIVSLTPATDIAVTADETTAYLALAISGEIVSVEIDPLSPGYATVQTIASGLVDPESMALNEEEDALFVVQDNPGSLVVVDVDSASPGFGSITEVASGFFHPFGVALLEDCIGGQPEEAEYGDAPDGIDSCQATAECTTPAVYPTVFGTSNAVVGRTAPYHVPPADPNADFFLGGAPTTEPEAFQPCCDWLDGFTTPPPPEPPCDEDNGPIVLCLVPNCSTGVYVTPGGMCDEVALDCFGPPPPNPATGYWLFDVSAGAFAEDDSSFVNVVTDWDLSGAYGDAPGEWVLQDSGGPSPFQSQLSMTGTFPVLTVVPCDNALGWCILPFWTRFHVSTEEIGQAFPVGQWDGSGQLGGYLGGETEDWVVFCDPGHPPSHADCDGNDIPDEVDVVRGAVNDCDGNRVPDRCQSDADGDGLIDACDSCPTVSDPGQALELRVSEEHGTVVRWNAIGAPTYDVIRGSVDQVWSGLSAVHLGSVSCIEADSTDAQATADIAMPDAGEAFFYLVRPEGGGYGLANHCRDRRIADSGDCR